jgi:carboxylesterase type B
VIGESAGAGSIMHHITSYGGKGSLPFQRAIPQSPAFEPTLPVEATAYLSEVLGNASLIANTTITTPAQLRLLPFEVLYLVNVIVVALSPYSSFTFGPVVDPSPGSYVPDFPLRLLATGRFHHIGVMVGHNSDEGLLFTPAFVQTQTEFSSFIAETFPTANESTVAYITNVLYPPVFNGSYGYTNAIERTALAIADFTITCNSHFLASTLHPSYAYLFSVSPGIHGVDIAYTFFNGDTSTPDIVSVVNATVATAFQQYLTSFAEHGKPRAAGFQNFVKYGKNGAVTNINDAGLGVHITDPAARPQCVFWQAAPYYSG